MDLVNTSSSLNYNLDRPYWPVSTVPRLNMELDLQSLFGLHVLSCAHWLIYEGAIGEPR
jgi:hypothetical protein